MTASKETKTSTVKAKCTGGQQFDCPMEVGHIINVDNIKYTIIRVDKI